MITSVSCSKKSLNGLNSIMIVIQEDITLRRRHVFNDGKYAWLPMSRSTCMPPSEDWKGIFPVVVGVTCRVDAQKDQLATSDSGADWQCGQWAGGRGPVLGSGNGPVYGNFLGKFLFPNLPLFGVSIFCTIRLAYTGRKKRRPGRITGQILLI